jgi:ankyrin repeat protein
MHADAKLTNQSGFNCIHFAAQCDHGSAIQTVVNVLNDQEKNKKLLLLSSTMMNHNDDTDDNRSIDSTYNKSTVSINSFESPTFINNLRNNNYNDNNNFNDNISITSSLIEKYDINSNEVNILLNKKSINGSTPLHLACLVDAIKSIKVLLLCNVLVNSQDNSNETALHKAAKNSFFEAYKLIKNSGGDEHCKNFLNETPFMLLN